MLPLTVCLVVYQLGHPLKFLSLRTLNNLRPGLKIDLKNFFENVQENILYTGERQNATK